jgi:hypothetical protein
MTKVSYIELSPEIEEQYKKGLQPGDRFTFSRVRVKDFFLSRARVKGITQKSMMVQLSPVWKAMTTGEQDAWNAAGAESGLTGWKQFVVDTSERRKAGHGGYATPNTIYQSEVGRIFVASPATGLTIEQAHPNKYYVQKKVPGTRSQYSPVAVFEPISLPLTIAISYKSVLTAAGDNPRARFFVRVYSSYQGRTLEKELSLDFDLVSDWSRVEATLTSVIGPIQGYEAFIEVHHARGNLYFDNVLIQHSGENWARDPDCNNVSQSFTRAFAQVARHWVAVDISDGADFGSFYYLP